MPETRTIQAVGLAPERPVAMECETPKPAAVQECRLEAANLPQPGSPGFLFFGAHRRSGTTWMTSLLNSNPEIHVRNEGWLFNDRGGSFETWLNRDRLNVWASGREARGTWLRDIRPDEAARLMQQAMLRTLYQQATVREGWKDWSKLRWCGDKTTNFYNIAADILADIFPGTPPPPGSPLSHARFLSMVRDGRDTVVSNLFLVFREEGWKGLPVEARAHALKSFDYHARGLGKPVPLFDAPLLRFLIHEWIVTVAGAQRAAEHYGPHGGFLEVRYEDLVAETGKQVRRVYEWLGVSETVSDARLEQVIDECKFENFSGGRKRGEADALAEWRKGIIGDWRNYFTEDDKRLFKAVAGGLLVELGYEKDLEW